MSKSEVVREQIVVHIWESSHQTLKCPIVYNEY